MVELSAAPVLRTAVLSDIAVFIQFEHQIQHDTQGVVRTLQHHERVHDSRPHFEKVIFSLEVDWLGCANIDFSARIESVYNYSPAYRFLTEEFHGTESLKAPLESLLDLLIAKASYDSRVVAVRATATRPNILLEIGRAHV